MKKRIYTGIAFLILFLLGIADASTLTPAVQASKQFDILSPDNDLNGNFSDRAAPYLVLTTSSPAQQTANPEPPAGGSIAGNFSTETFTLNPIPEPATALLIGLALLGLAGAGRKAF